MQSIRVTMFLLPKGNPILTALPQGFFNKAMTAADSARLAGLMNERKGKEKMLAFSRK